MAGSPRFGRLYANDGRSQEAKLTEFYEGSPFVTSSMIKKEAQQNGDPLELTEENKEETQEPDKNLIA
jgi:hypothetical protein